MRMGLGGAGAPGPLRLGRPLTDHAAVLDVVEQFPDLRTPPESSWKLPGTIPEKTELFPEPEQQLSIYKSLPPDHFGTPRHVRDLIRDSELLEICPRGNNKLVIIILYFSVHDNRVLSMLELY